MVGKVLGNNRYELIEKIGGGGMALVYKAKCRLLNRYVAIKILRPEFTNDEEFVNRFRIEAQAAASLSHPNIVSIYDVGQEDNIHYIVMELVDGITLKEYINQKGCLDWEEAVDITIQICSAIEHAHRNHIVHRDIKPHNILLTREGIAKVTDFGIARAVTSSTITMVGSTIGSVHYFSPEQARGGYIDEKSDLYSIGIAMYEMVTGQLPFNGDTPVAVALKHIQDIPVEPIKLNGNIPKGVNDIIMKAIKKEQDKRYQTASDMLSDLYRVLKEPDGGFIINEDLYEDCPTKRMDALGNAVLAKKDEYKIKEDEEMKKKKKAGDRLTVVLALITSSILIFIGGFMTYRYVVSSLLAAEDNNFVMGDYVGRDAEEVKAMLEEHGLKVKMNMKYSDDVEAGKVMAQDPEEGKTIKLGGYIEIQLDVSQGPQLITIPALRNTDYRLAQETLQQEGLKVTLLEEHSEEVGIGLVIRTEPDAGTEVKKDTEVILVRSLGPEIKKTIVPNIIGLTQVEAKKRIAERNLTLGKITPETGSNYVDKIIKQSPPAGTEVDEGTPVNFELEVSNEIIVNKVIRLIMPEKYDDTMVVRVEITPSDTNVKEVLMPDTEVKKTDFPITVAVPVPKGGSVLMMVYINDMAYLQEVVTGG